MTAQETQNLINCNKIVRHNTEYHLLSNKVEETGCNWNHTAYYHVDAAGDEYVITKDTFKPNPRFSRKILLSTDKSLGVPELPYKYINR